MENKRDDNFLQGRLDDIWDRYFYDVEQKNDVRIIFGRKARTRLGSIKQESRKFQNSNDKLQIKYKLSNSKNQKRKVWIPADAGMTREKKPVSRLASQPVSSTIITINGLFKNPDIPEFLIDSVIAHEMVHYAHGFCSPHEKKYDNPHARGIIKKEMQERGLDDLFFLQKKWLKTEWKKFLQENYPRALKRRIVVRRRKSIFRLF